MAPSSPRQSVFWYRMRARLSKWARALGIGEDYYLIGLSILIGGATGLGAHLFYTLIEMADAWCYGHDGSRSGGLYSGKTFMLVALPAIAALAVGLITRFFAREAKGHGVPEVMDALHRGGGSIRPRVAVAKAISSTLTIGSGGSAGTEGPIIQIGAAIGSTFGQALKVTRRQMSVLIACGVSGGIAAIFNAPIAGVLFALEIFLKDFSFRTFSPVVFASVLSCSLTHAFRPEDRGIFETAGFQDYQYTFDGSELPFYLILGLICAATAVIFIRGLYFTEDVADRIRLPEALKPAIGAVILGVTGIAYCSIVNTQDAPPFFGNGYPTIELITGAGIFEMSITVLLVMCALKVLATCLTLGFGGSGGVFAPSLMMGAAVGGALGLGLYHFGWIEQNSVSAYALVGMAALVAGTTHAPMTAIVILYELTREPKVILPVMFAAIVSTFGAQLLLKDSIYTLKLRRRGVRFGTLADLTILQQITVEDLHQMPAPTVHPQDPLQKLLDMAAETDAANFVVTDEEDVYQGLVVADDIKTALLQPEAVPLLLVAELMRDNVPVIRPNEPLDEVLNKFAKSDVPVLAVGVFGEEGKIDGLVSWQSMVDRYHKELDRPAG